MPTLGKALWIVMILEIIIVTVEGQSGEAISDEITGNYSHTMYKCTFIIL